MLVDAQDPALALSPEALQQLLMQQEELMEFFHSVREIPSPLPDFLDR